MIKAIRKELHDAKLLVLETLVPTPSANKIEITILEPDPSNINPELAIVAQPVFIMKSEKLPDPLMFNKN